jgi:hypothetical protein
VYSSEIGYLYAGDEYWQTFEEMTPGWISHGDRNWIRKCFIHFHEHFYGARPTGAWADKFSIICWPIANAILPRDLQEHLAKILYLIKNDITDDILASPSLIGGLIASRSSSTPSRFQQLAQEPSFIGQIALALLLKDQPSTLAYIDPSTLDRIADDLERVQSARAWIRGARDSVRTRVRVGKTKDGQPRQERKQKDSRALHGFSLEPQIILSSEDKEIWDIILQLPNFSGLLGKFPNLRDILLNSVCYVPSTSDRPKGRGWVLYGPPGIKLNEWLDHGQPLIRFAPSAPDLDYLIQSGCRIRPGPPWLFRLAADGLAYQQKSARVRANEEYIVLTDKAYPETHPQFVQKLRSSCTGINVFKIQIPAAISEELRGLLSQLNLSVAGSITIWPVGLSPSRWDEEGEFEWLSTDAPVLGIRADHQVALFSLKLGSRTLEAVPEIPGTPVFIELTGLEIGANEIRITAYNNRGEEITRPETIKIFIRNPEPTLGGNLSKAFFVVLDPNQPTLEQIWEDLVDFYIHGPRHKHLITTISFYQRGQAQPIQVRRLPPISLPVGVSEWHRHFGSFKGEMAVQNAYDESCRCRLDLRAEEFGAFIINAERDFSPIRWALRREKAEYSLELRDDSGSNNQPRIWHFGFEQPDKGSSLDPHTFLDRGGQLVKGGLYLAKQDNFGRSIIIPPEVHSWGDLIVKPNVSWWRKTPDEICNLIKILDYWNIARLTGGFSNYSKKVVVEALLNKALFLIYDRGYFEIEKALQNENGSEILQDLYWHLPKDEFNIVLALDKQMPQLASLGLSDRIPKLDTLMSELVDPRLYRGSLEFEWLLAFTLRLASCSKYLIRWASTGFRGAIGILLKAPGLLRVSRIMVLLTDKYLRRDKYVSAQFYEGWEWR